MTIARSSPLFKVQEPIFLPRQATPLDAGHDVRLYAPDPLSQKLLDYLGPDMNRDLYYNGAFTNTQDLALAEFIATGAQGIVLLPGESRLVSLGFSVALPLSGNKFYNWAMLIVPRSGLGGKTGLVLRNTIGVVDAGYRNMAMAWLHNTNLEHSHVVSHRTRIGQALFVHTSSLNSFSDEELIVDEFPAELAEVDRGGGFGSTGLH